MNLTLSGNAKPLLGNPQLPGDKSISHRALLLASLAEGPSRIRNFLHAGVTDVMVKSLSALGIETEYLNQDDLLVLGHVWQAPERTLDCGNSGTTMRFLLGALASSTFVSTLDGTDRLRQRPMARVVEPLTRMGANIRTPSAKHLAPLTIQGGPLHGIEYTLPVASAQVKTALLIAALNAEGPTILEEPGPSRDHTERMLISMGVSLQKNGNRIRLEPENTKLPPLSTTVPRDISAAAFLITAALIVPGSRLYLNQLGVNPTRTGLIDVIKRMGARIKTGPVTVINSEPVTDLEISFSELQATDIFGENVVRMIDEFPIFAIAATQAKGTTTVRDAGELRIKESDRITALVTELRKMGAAIEECSDGFVVDGPTRLKGAVVQSHGDHRLAMALSIAGLVAEGETVVEGADSIEQSFPSFPSVLAEMGVDIR
ncbi:MAG: 3-phosphoshikimate 1-carboxyvinyltransferase [Anaerolineales bacterium]|nr:3-phosphoshikimate 1-carboxyvinyltransferase [Anaerolineales bacterium]